jgi:uncharacterized membrane protein
MEKRMKNLKKIFILSIFLLLAFMISNVSYAGEQEWNSLEYNVILNMDGSADIVETWDVDISETNTLFKDFDMSDSSYSIDKVKVYQVVDGIEIPLEQIYEEQYHVDSGCYYGLQISSSKFEIAWNVGLDNSSATRTYRIYYTVENAVKIYSDCTEFYWQFLSSDNTMTGKNISALITIPDGVTDIEKLHIWSHGDLSGYMEKLSNTQVKYTLDRLYANSMVEVRVVTEDNIYEESNNLYQYSKLSSILEEEQQWADEANAQRTKARFLFVAGVVVVATIFIFYLIKIIKYVRAGKELKEQKYISNIQYFRDIPDEKNATPARAAYMYYFLDSSSGFRNNSAKIFSATILQLTLKKYISLEPIDKKNVKINILEKTDRLEPLNGDESAIYSLIVRLSNKTTNSLETNELERYAKKEYDEFYALNKRVCDSAESYQLSRNIIDKERQKIHKKWRNKGTAYITAILIFIFVLPPLIPILLPIFIEFILGAVFCLKNAKTISVLTEEGFEEVNEWKGLKKYMEEFSLLKDKEVPDLILWEKYLVYATTFGISKKVIDQLVKVYPQMTSEEYYRNGNYTYLYIASNHGFDSLDSLDRTFSHVCQTANSAYSAAHSSSSSGSGGGGGSSGGGGGRRRWRKLRWKIKSHKIKSCLFISRIF